MDVRVMPTITFRCDCGYQESIVPKEFCRFITKEDRVKPWPKHHGKNMDIIQIQYYVEGVTIDTTNMIMGNALEVRFYEKIKKRKKGE